MTGCETGVCKMWDVRERHNRRMYHTFQGHSDAVTCVTFAPVRVRMYTASKDSSIVCWNITEDFLVHNRRPDGSRISRDEADRTMMMHMR